MTLSDITTGSPVSRVAEIIFGLPVPHADALGLMVERFQPPKMTVRLPYQDFLVGDWQTGLLQGGGLSALIDTACGFLAMVSLEPVRPVATLDLRIDYLRPARVGYDVLCAAEAYRITRRMVFLRATAWQQREAGRREVAAAAGTFMITSQEIGRIGEAGA